MHNPDYLRTLKDKKGEPFSEEVIDQASKTELGMAILPNGKLDYHGKDKEQVLGLVDVIIDYLKMTYLPQFRQMWDRRESFMPEQMLRRQEKVQQRTGVIYQ